MKWARDWAHAKHAVALKLREAAMAYPLTVEEFPWEHPAYKVAGKKAFLFLGGYADALTVSMKLPFRSDEALSVKGASRTGYGLGRSGWITFSFAPRARAPMARLVDYLDESWRAVAPKTLSASHAPPVTRGERS